MRLRAPILLILVAALGIVAEAASVTRGPYLQSGTPSSVIIRWRTDIATDSRVLFGNSPANLAATVSDATATTEHELTLTGLSADTTYFYAVGTTAQTLAGADANHFFLTAPPVGTEKSTRVWVLGDAGTGTAAQLRVRDAYYTFTGPRHTDLWMMLGDNAYSVGTDSEYQTAVFNIYAAMLRKSVLWPTLGNHDTAHATDFNDSYPYFNIFTLPKQGEAGGLASGTEHYYSFDYANVHFICLDSQTASRAPAGAMATWLTQDLAATTQRWVVAFFHHPPYTKGSHNSDTESQLIEMRANFLPILEDGGVDLVLTGHSHSYERSRLIDGFYATPTLAGSGTFKDAGDGRPAGNGAYGKDDGPGNGAVYTVAGSSGQISGGSLNHPVMVSSLNVLGSLVLDFAGNRLDATFIDDFGVTRDNFTLLKGPAVSITATSPQAAEWGALPGELTLTRSGAATSVLTVEVNITGTATNGVDYQTITIPVTIPAGAASATIPVQPLADDLAEGPESVTLTLTPTTSYRLGTQIAGTVMIEDRPSDQWRRSKFNDSELANAAISGWNSDPDGDRATNLAEYFFALEPQIPDQPAIASEQVGNQLTLTYTRLKAAVDVTITPEVTGDFQPPWESGPTAVEISPPVDHGLTETVVVQDKTIGAPQRFIRLRILRP